jgi:hypothetical protein
MKKHPAWALGKDNFRPDDFTQGDNIAFVNR